MRDELSDSTALLEKLVRQVMHESDPVKYNQFAAELWRVLECEHLRNNETLDQETCRFGI
jgi:hypothetical protein